MKVSIELDLTPQEARELLGMPDVATLQKKWASAIEEKVEEELKTISPDALLKSWMKSAAGNTDFLAGLLKFPGFKTD